MSKVSSDDLDLAIKNIFARTQLKDYKFGANGAVETVDIQFKLRNYGPKDKRFAGSVRLIHDVRKNCKVCILGNKKDFDEAVSKNFKALNISDMEKFKNKNKKIRNKKVKQLASQYTGFVASKSLIAKIPRVLGPGLSKAGKFPATIETGETIEEKVAEIAKTVKFQFKKEVCIGSAIGHLELKPEELKVNINTCINFLVSLLKKNWQNVGSISIKSNQGRPQRIFPSGKVDELSEEQQVERKAAAKNLKNRKKVLERRKNAELAEVKE